MCLTLGFDYAELKRYDDLPKQQFRTLNILLESFWSRCLVVSVEFLGHSGPSWVSAAPSSGHLDHLTILLSICRESKAV